MVPDVTPHPPKDVLRWTTMDRGGALCVMISGA